MRWLAVVVGLCALAAPLEGQMVVTHDTLDVERRTLRDALIVLRDSLQTVEAAAAQFQRGNAAASDQLLLSRGRTVHTACVRSVRNVAPTRSVVKQNDWDDQYRSRLQTALLQALDSLEQSLEACDSLWNRPITPEDAQAIRATGQSDAVQLARDVKYYDSAVADYLKALDIYVSPIGAPPSVIP